jgi:hypothetical protein
MHCLSHVVVWLVAANYQPAAAVADDPAASYARKFLDETINEARFSKPHQMDYHVDLAFPENKPNVYALRAVYRHWVMPPYYRLEAVIGPFEPSKQAPVRHVKVSNGASEVSLRYDPQGRQNGALVTRGREATDSARRNKLWAELGIPVSRSDFEEASHGSYWLRAAVSTKNGYMLSPKPVVIGGVKCVVIRKENKDCLWFSVDAPTRLMKRDFWRNSGSPERHVVEFSNYNESGLPANIVITRYLPVNRIGESSLIRGVETLSLDRIEFVETPAKEFIVTLDDHVAVLDVNTRTAIQMEPSGTPPFEKLLRNSQGPIKMQPRSGIGWIVDINVLMLSAIVLIMAIRRWVKR